MAGKIYKLETKLKIDKELMESPNLVSRFSDEDLKCIGEMVWDGYVSDVSSRSDWLRRNEAGMNFALQVSKEKSWPWPGCSNVIFPLITIAALQFSSRAYGNIINGTDIVKCRVIGDDPSGNLQARADRISMHMSWQCLEQDQAWEEQHDRLFLNESIVGTAFIKSTFNSTLGYVTGDLVLAKDLVMNYYAKSVDACPRKTHVIPLFRNDIYERVRREVFKDVLEEKWYTSGAPSADGQPHALQAQSQAQQDKRQGMHPPEPDEDTPFQFLEQHRLLDLDQDGYSEPYIVTIEATSKCVVRIVARWDKVGQVERNEKDQIICIRPTEYFTKYGFIPSPDGGIYDIGFGVLLGPINEAVNTSINQLLDAGTMQNSLGGFIGRGAKLRGGEYAMAPWEWKRVDSTGDDLRKNLIPIPDRQPSVVLFNLLNLLIEYTKQMASVADQMVGKTPGQNTPAETSRNALEQGMQVFSTIFKRIWRSMKDEFKKRYVLNGIFLDVNFKFGQGKVARREDYLPSGADLVVPTADPNITSLSQRFFQAQSIRQAAREVPGYDLAYVERNFLQALRVESIDKFYPGPDKVPGPKDPKLTIAELNAKMTMLQLKEARMQFALQLMEDRRLNTAKIMELKTKSLANIEGLKAEKAAQQIEVLQMAIDALQRHNEMINERLQMINDSEAGETNENANPQGAGPTGPGEGATDPGAGSLEGGPDDTSDIPTPEAMA